MVEGHHHANTKAEQRSDHPDRDHYHHVLRRPHASLTGGSSMGRRRNGDWPLYFSRRLAFSSFVLPCPSRGLAPSSFVLLCLFQKRCSAWFSGLHACIAP